MGTQQGTHGSLSQRFYSLKVITAYAVFFSFFLNLDVNAADGIEKSYASQNDCVHRVSLTRK